MSNRERKSESTRIFIQSEILSGTGQRHKRAKKKSLEPKRGGRTREDALFLDEVQMPRSTAKKTVPDQLYVPTTNEITTGHAPRISLSQV